MQMIANGLSPCTKHTLTLPGILAENLRTVRHTGIAYALEERTLGASSVAAPVFGPDRTLLASLSVWSTPPEASATSSSPHAPPPSGSADNSRTAGEDHRPIPRRLHPLEPHSHPAGQLIRVPDHMFYRYAAAHGHRAIF